KADQRERHHRQRRADDRAPRRPAADDERAHRARGERPRRRAPGSPPDEGEHADCRDHPQEVQPARREPGDLFEHHHGALRSTVALASISRASSPAPAAANGQNSSVYSVYWRDSTRDFSSASIAAYTPRSPSASLALKCRPSVISAMRRSI